MSELHRVLHRFVPIHRPQTHNDFFSGAMTSASIDPSLFGYASIQLDGGIEKVSAKVAEYFSRRGAADAAAPPPPRAPSDARALAIGLHMTERLAPEEASLTVLALARAISAAGGVLVLPSTLPLLKSGVLTDALALDPAASVTTLAFAQSVYGRSHSGGVHIMDMPSVTDWSETVTGLAATGVHAIVALSLPPRKGHAKVTNGHPIVPVLHIGLRPSSSTVAADPAWVAATDAILSAADSASPADTAEEWASNILALVARTATGGGYRPKASALPYFNVTRGPTGVST